MRSPIGKVYLVGAGPGSGRRGRLRNSAVEKKSGSVSAARIGDRGSIAASFGRFETTYGLPIEETAFIDMEHAPLGVERQAERERRLVKEGAAATSSPRTPLIPTPSGSLRYGTTRQATRRH